MLIRQVKAENLGCCIGQNAPPFIALPLHDKRDILAYGPVDVRLALFHTTAAQ